MTKPHGRTVGDETSASAAPAFEAAADQYGTDAVVNQHSNNLLERHTSAAKDGVIDMLTTKASKLGVSLERALLARKEAGDNVDRLQVSTLLDYLYLKMSSNFGHNAEAGVFSASFSSVQLTHTYRRGRYAHRKITDHLHNNRSRAVRSDKWKLFDLLLYHEARKIHIFTKGIYTYVSWMSSTLCFQRQGTASKYRSLKLHPSCSFRNQSVMSRLGAQVLFDGETIKRKDVEHLLQQKEKKNKVNGPVDHKMWKQLTLSFTAMRGTVGSFSELAPSSRGKVTDRLNYLSPAVSWRKWSRMAYRSIDTPPNYCCCASHHTHVEPIYARPTRRRCGNQRSEQENGHLKWEVDTLRVELQDAEERAKGWLQVRNC